MLSPTECMLKAENYAAAACLDADADRMSNYLKLAALWRSRAVHLRTGGRLELIPEPNEPVGLEALWH